MALKLSNTEKRKMEHISIALKKKIEFKCKTNGLECIEFENCALPEIDLDAISLQTSFLGKKFAAPLMIEPMTGGCAGAEKINRQLAEAAEEEGIGFGVGSQRAMIEDPTLSHTFKVRDVAPNIFLGGDIGVTQLLEYTPKRIREAMEAIEADALFVCLNAAQEAVQPEGDGKWRGCLAALEKLCDQLGLPVIAKEAGSGISAKTAKQLENAGVSAIDVSGAGGTSWTAIEVYRKGSEAGNNFWDWGIPTAQSIAQCKSVTKLPIIGSGGLRSGLDCAKAIRLGASIAGAALPFLKAQSKGGSKAVQKEIMLWKNELRIAMFLTASKDLNALGKAKLL